jgi:hypothetical protein
MGAFRYIGIGSMVRPGPDEKEILDEWCIREASLCVTLSGRRHADGCGPMSYDEDVSRNLEPWTGA